MLGACWFLLHAHVQMEDNWPEERAGTVASVVGQVMGLPERRGDQLRFRFAPDRSLHPDLPDQIQVSWFRPLDYVRPGERWRMMLSLYPPTGRLNPGGFDASRHFLSMGIGATARVQGQAERMPGPWIEGTVDRSRQYLAERLQAETTQLDHAALLRALGLADRTAIDTELRQLLQRTGTAHLLAISGLHIGMVAGLAGLLGGWLLSPLILASASLDRRRLTVISGLMAGLAYAWLAGFTLPTVRALIMLTVASAALSVRRGISPGHALLLALIAILLLDPLAPLSVGFWLSFSAVAILIWAFAWRPGRSTSGWLRGLIVAQLVIAVGMLPLNVGIFQQWMPGAILANLVAIPLVGFWILPWLLATLLAMLLNLPVDWMIAAAEIGLYALLFALRWVNGLSGAYWAMPAVSLSAVILASFGGMWLLAPPGWPGRWLGAFLFLPLLFTPERRDSPDALSLTVFDVGDGQAVLLESAGRQMLYDTGPGDGQGRDALRGLIRGLIPRASGYALDGVVVSRAHRSHAGGLGTAQELSHPLRVRVHPGLEGRPCVAGEEWSLGKYTMRFLHPSGALPDLGDNSSCVVLVEGPGGRILLTGGIDRAVERRLLLENPELRADVLLLSAGGHRRGAGGVFLDRLDPRLAVASVDRYDRFDRPHAEVVERLQQRDIEMLATGRCGAVYIRLEPDQYPKATTERANQRKFWLSADGCP